VQCSCNFSNIIALNEFNNLSIPCLRSSYFLRARYSLSHITGIVICLGGLTCIIASDFAKEDGMSDAVVGDILCLCGAFLYACSNVIQEKIVKTKNREEYLGMVGLFGAALAAVQSLATDLSPMSQASWDAYIGLCIIGFVLCLNCMYINTSVFLQSGDATFFNLSLLTSDVYAVIFSYLLTGQLVHWLYFVGFGLVFVGLALYHSSEKPVSTNLLLQAENSVDVPVSAASSVNDGYPSPSVQHSTNYNPLSDGNLYSVFPVNDDEEEESRHGGHSSNNKH